MKFSNFAVLALVACLSGCVEKNVSSANSTGTDRSELPEELRPLQGEWTVKNGEGRMSVEGRTLQLIFRNDENDQLYRRNAFIENVDAEAHELEMHGESAPWHYAVHQDGLEESVLIRFYDPENRVWAGSVMSRRAEGLAGL